MAKGQMKSNKEVRKPKKAALFAWAAEQSVGAGQRHEDF
jgi:hypothetical protein